MVKSNNLFIFNNLNKQVTIIYLQQKLVIVIGKMYNIELNMLIINNLVKKN
jgi:hypothetical protein